MFSYPRQIQRLYECDKVSLWFSVTQEHICHTMGEEIRQQRDDMHSIKTIDNVTKVRRLSLWLG